MPAHRLRSPSTQDTRHGPRTQYTGLLIQADNVSLTDNILAAASTWILLAGYIVFPATFKKLQKRRDLDVEDMDDEDERGEIYRELSRHVLGKAQHTSLVVIASISCTIGLLGCVWLWKRHRKNYIWLVNKIFLPTVLHSVAGLVSTLINIYTAQEGQYSATAMSTLVVTSVCLVGATLLLFWYYGFKLWRIKRDHKMQVPEPEERARRRHRGRVDP